MINLNEFISEKLHINADSKPKEADATTHKVGDVLYGQGGWSMILPHFYQVISRTAKSYRVKELKQKIVSGGGFQGEVEPIRNEFKDNKEYRCVVSKYGLKIDGHRVELWDGKPKQYDHLD